MHDDDGYDIDDESGFDPGDLVVITTDEDLKVGILMGLNGFGAHLKVTHRIEEAELTVTPESEQAVREAFGEVSKNRLRLYVLSYDVTFRDMLKMEKEELVEVCTVKTIVEQLEKQAKPKVLKELANTIKTFVPMERILEIESGEDYSNETILRDLDFTVAVEG